MNLRAMARALLLGPVLAWALSRAALVGGYGIARSMRSEIPPLPPGDLLCGTLPCEVMSFAPWLLPGLGVLVGAVGLWLLVLERDGAQAAGWAVGLWLVAPSTLSLQVSPTFAWASALVFLGLAFAVRGRVGGATVALVGAALLAPAAGVAAVAAAGLAWQRGRAAWWVPLFALGAAGAALRGGLQAVLPGGPLGTLTPSVSLGVTSSRLQVLLLLVPLSVALFSLLSARDWPLALGGVAVAFAGAAMGAPTLGRALGAAPGWALWGRVAERFPVARAGALVGLTIFQGLLLHFYAHRYPIL